MANILSQAAHGLSLGEKRIIFSAVAKMGGMNNGLVKITAIEYAETFDLPLNQAYNQLKDAAQNIWNRYATLRETDRKGDMVMRFRWIDAYQYHDGLGYVSLGFTHWVLPYLMDLEQQFTKYKLKQACALRSVYSWRLLELFEQMRGKKSGQEAKDGWLLVTIEDFWHSMEVAASHRKNYKDLRKKVIEPAVKELSEKDSWLIQWEAIKEGRRVAHLCFKFEKNPQGELDI